MSHRWATTTVAALSLITAFAAAAPAGASPTGPARIVVQAQSAGAERSAEVGATPLDTSVEFDVVLKVRDVAGAQALARAVSDPSTNRYGRYLTPAAWERAFSPSPSSVDAVTSWLRSEQITVASVAADRLTVHATASAARVEAAFAVPLNEYRRLGRTVRLAAGALTVPRGVASVISGVTGVDEMIASRASAPAAEAAPTNHEPTASPATLAPPAGFRIAPPCSAYFGQKADTTDPALGPDYDPRQVYQVCGYRPPQLQQAYGLTNRIATGNDGTGVTVAVLDAYASPNLFADAHQYSVRNQPAQVLASGQFSEIVDRPFNETDECSGSGWFTEAALDVEAVHATAPGAHILYEGAQNCEVGLYNSLADIIDHHRADIVSNSWTFYLGDVYTPAAVRAAYENLFLMAAATGVGIQFASGDYGDNFAGYGVVVANYPATSPYVTSVGGTSLQIARDGGRGDEVGWSSSYSYLCGAVLVANGFCDASQLGSWAPPAPGSYLWGGGGGTSYKYGEPWYQDAVVPAALANRNAPTTGTANRVEPDISMDGDPGTGMLLGLTQTFPDGIYYSQFPEGGTSLASPLLAGVLADADQAAHRSLGFVNPLLYRVTANPSVRSTAFHDEMPPTRRLVEVFDGYWNNVNRSAGAFAYDETFAFEGAERFCGATCASKRVTLTTTRGFDSMTGIGSPGPNLIPALSARP